MINLESMHENEFSSMIVGLMRGAKQTLDGITGKLLGNCYYINMIICVKEKLLFCKMVGSATKGV